MIPLENGSGHTGSLLKDCPNRVCAHTEGNDQRYFHQPVFCFELDDPPCSPFDFFFLEDVESEEGAVRFSTAGVESARFLNSSRSLSRLGSIILSQEKGIWKIKIKTISMVSKLYRIFVFDYKFPYLWTLKCLFLKGYIQKEGYLSNAISNVTRCYSSEQEF